MSEVKKKRVSYTQLTLKYLRRQGYLCEVVEKWINFGRPGGGGIRRDLFNIIDIIAVKPGSILGVQSTSLPHRDDHLVKLTEAKGENSIRWLESGAGLQLITWEKIGHRWQPTVDDITPSGCLPQPLPES